MKTKINKQRFFLVIALVSICLLTLLMYYSKNKYKNINLIDFEQDEEIYLEIKDIKLDDNYILISGITYDISQECSYSNYMMKDGKNLYRDFGIIIIADNSYEVYTQNQTIDADEVIEDTIYEKRDFGFTAKFKKELVGNNKFRIGVLYKSLDGIMKYKVLDDEYVFE